jgi:rhodanese-related sulfurtransferase
LKKKNKKIITVCQSGARSGMATTILAKAGMEAFNGGNWSSLQNKLQ